MWISVLGFSLFEGGSNAELRSISGTAGQWFVDVIYDSLDD